MIKGAIAPEKPLSFDHWMSSFGVVSTFGGGYLMAGGASPGIPTTQGLIEYGNRMSGIAYGSTMAAGTVANANEVGTSTVGRWMSDAKYSKMVGTGQVQMSPNGNTTYVANPANPSVFKAAPSGSVYVQFDVPTSSIYPAGNANWGQIPGPGSLIDRLGQSKGLPPITGMPPATNIQIIGGD